MWLESRQRIPVLSDYLFFFFLLFLPGPPICGMVPFTLRGSDSLQLIVAPSNFQTKEGFLWLVFGWSRQGFLCNSPSY